MSVRTIIIDGNYFSNLEGFYFEMDRVLADHFQSGHNLNAFNDLLRGGFGVHEYEEPIKLIWQHSEKSRRDLGTFHDGGSVYESLVDVISGHRHIEFVET